MRKIKGFTLIELLVVISIIALLMSILMPSLRKAREQARKIVCQNNLKTIGIADQIYAQDSDDFHVPVLNGLSPDNELWFQNKLFVRIVSLKGRYNPEAEQGYNALTLPRDFRCPTDNRTVGKGFILYADGTIEGVSYGMNGMSLYSKDGWHYYEQHSPTKPRMAHALTTSQVVKPSSKLFFMDAVWHVVDYGAADYVRYWDKYGDQMGRWAWDAPSYRHSEGANVLFYDGHVKYMQKQEIYQRPPGLTVPQQWRLNMQLWQPIPGRSYIDKPYN